MFDTDNSLFFHLLRNPPFLSLADSLLSFSSATTQCKTLFSLLVVYSSVLSPVPSVAPQQVMSLTHWALTTQHTHTDITRVNLTSLLCLDTSFTLVPLTLHFLLIPLFLCSHRPAHSLSVLSSILLSSFAHLLVFSSTYTNIVSLFYCALFFCTSLKCSPRPTLTYHLLVVFSSTYTSLLF